MLYIPPVNYEYGIELWAERFKIGYEENAEHIRCIAKETDTKILDLSYLLKRNNFADECTIDETANMAGRILIKDEIINALRSV